MREIRPGTYNNNCIFFEPPDELAIGYCIHTDNPIRVCSGSLCPRFGEQHYERDQINERAAIVWSEAQGEWSFVLKDGTVVILPGESADMATTYMLTIVQEEQYHDWRLDQHTEECTEMVNETLHARRKWEAKYPNYCKVCDGVGGHEYGATLYYPDGSGEPGGYDICSCVEENRCPRCGSPWIVWLVSANAYDEYVRYVMAGIDTSYPEGDVPFCPSCGWIDNWGECSTPGAPQVWECDCWYQEDKKVPDDWFLESDFEYRISGDDNG